jgi:hypothetical protein
MAGNITPLGAFVAAMAFVLALGVTRALVRRWRRSDDAARGRVPPPSRQVRRAQARRERKRRG